MDELARALLTVGIEAARGGARETAQEALEEALELDPGSEEGWLWLAAIQKEREAQKRCLLKILEINPAHPHARALRERPEFRDEPQRQPTRCPLCGGERPAGSDRCPRCRAVLSFADLPALLDNAEVDLEAVQQVIRTREGLASWGGGTELHLALALAHLNLGRLEPGLRHLEALSARRSSDETLKLQIKALKRRIGGLDAEEPESAEEPLEAPAPVETIDLGELVETGAVAPDPADPANPDDSGGPADRIGTGHAAVAAPALLAIDDSATVRKLVASSLSSHGFRVLTASDAAEGLARLQEHRVGLVLLDAELAEADGYRVLKAIKSDPSTAHVPVFLLTGRGGGLLERRRARKAGSSGHLNKPFAPEELLDLARKTCLA